MAVPAPVKPMLAEKDLAHSVPSPMRSAFRAADGTEAAWADCVERLCSAAQGRRGAPFEIPLASFVAAFGEKGAYSYGQHRVSDGSGEGDWKHVVEVTNKVAINAMFGESPAAAVIGRFTLHYDGVKMAELWTERAENQADLAATFLNGTRPTKQQAAAAAAAKAAIETKATPFVIDSESEEEQGGEAQAKRQRTDAQ